MQAGFAMLEAGTTRAKNIKNILLKVLFSSSFPCSCASVGLATS
jgi:ammonia channel protein AmtB